MVRIIGGCPGQNTAYLKDFNTNIIPCSKCGNEIEFRRKATEIFEGVEFRKTPFSIKSEIDRFLKSQHRSYRTIGRHLQEKNSVNWSGVYSEYGINEAYYNLLKDIYEK